MKPARIVILSEGHSNPHTAKTACSVLRYRTEEVVALLDSTHAGETTGQLLRVGGEIPVVADLDEVPSADTLLVGIAPPGGHIPETWRPVILEAIRRGLTVISGLHDHLIDDSEFARAAQQHGVRLVDLRRNNDRTIARHLPFRAECLRVLTVGHDCSVGKMVTAWEVHRELNRRQLDSEFLATGQTGMLLSEQGCPIDSVVADFVSGSVEQLVLKNQQHDFLLIEGQGSLVHPSYSGVTLSLLHGAVPQGLILCYQVGRTTVTGIPDMPIPGLERIRELNETMASVVGPCEVIGVSMNSSAVTDAEAEVERQRVEQLLALPVCDVFRDGPGLLADAVVQLRRRLSSG